MAQKLQRRLTRLRQLWLMFCSFLALLLIALLGLFTPTPAASADPLPPLIFVARSHLATQDHIFKNERGPAGQFGTGLAKFAPGSKLVRRNADGSLFVYNTPELVDVQSPDVSFDGTKLVFAGATTLAPDTTNSGWRLYEINVDGSGFRQLTFSDRTFAIPNAAHFLNQQEYGTYDDLFPAYLADGRIVFVSSRYPSRSHYDDRRTLNLYVMNADGGNLHRVTSERGSIWHPTPLPDGRILVARWWNQFNQPTETGIYNRIDNADTDQTLPDGTVILANPSEQFNPATGRLADGFPIRDAPNTWHLMTINPDGTDFQRFAWTPAFRWSLAEDDGVADTYHAAQPAVIQRGDALFVAFTAQPDATMFHSTLNTGIRVAQPGVAMTYANARDALVGLSFQKAWANDDESPPYALHPWGLPDGRILYSQTREEAGLPTTGQHVEGGQLFKLYGSNLRYELYVMDLDGANQTPVAIDLSAIGLATADMMDAKPIVARTGWTAKTDLITAIANDDPALGNLPNTLPAYSFSQRSPNEIQMATLHNPNIYANPPLTLPYVGNSPPPGSVATVEFWVDANQFSGGNCYDDWPEPCATFRKDTQVRAILWTTAPVTPLGAFTLTVPADTPSFFVLRDVNGRVVRDWNRGYISIAQGNAWARPGENVTCTGCHMGHVSGSLAGLLDEANQGWTNVAPYAEVSASSFFNHNDPNSPEYQPFRPHFLNDRRGWVPIPAGGPAAPFAASDGLHDASGARFIYPSQVRAALNPNYQDDESSWLSAKGQAVGEWVELQWTKPLLIKSVRLVGVPSTGGDWEGFGKPEQDGPYAITAGELQLFRNDNQIGNVLTVGRVEPLENGGTLITLSQPVEVDRLRFTISAVTGRWHWETIAALNEIEVMGMATSVTAPPVKELNERYYLPTVRRR